MHLNIYHETDRAMYRTYFGWKNWRYTGADFFSECNYDQKWFSQFLWLRTLFFSLHTSPLCSGYEDNTFSSSKRWIFERSWQACSVWLLQIKRLWLSFFVLLLLFSLSAYAAQSSFCSDPDSKSGSKWPQPPRPTCTAAMNRPQKREREKFPRRLIIGHNRLLLTKVWEAEAVVASQLKMENLFVIAKLKAM
jgi:hypothetical protein